VTLVQPGYRVSSAQLSRFVRPGWRLQAKIPTSPPLDKRVKHRKITSESEKTYEKKKKHRTSRWDFATVALKNIQVKPFFKGYKKKIGRNGSCPKNILGTWFTYRIISSIRFNKNRWIVTFRMTRIVANAFWTRACAEVISLRRRFPLSCAQNSGRNWILFLKRKGCLELISMDTNLVPKMWHFRKRKELQEEEEE